MFSHQSDFLTQIVNTRAFSITDVVKILQVFNEQHKFAEGIHFELINHYIKTKGLPMFGELKSNSTTIKQSVIEKKTDYHGQLTAVASTMLEDITCIVPEIQTPSKIQTGIPTHGTVIKEEITNEIKKLVTDLSLIRDNGINYKQSAFNVVTTVVSRLGIGPMLALTYSDITYKVMIEFELLNADAPSMEVTETTTTETVVGPEKEYTARIMIYAINHGHAVKNYLKNMYYSDLSFCSVTDTTLDNLPADFITKIKTSPIHHKITRQDCRVHQGLNFVYNVIRDKMLYPLLYCLEFYKVSRIVIGGYDYGGTLANLLAMDLTMLSSLYPPIPNNIIVYTFGCPEFIVDEDSRQVFDDNILSWRFELGTHGKASKTIIKELKYYPVGTQIVLYSEKEQSLAQSLEPGKIPSPALYHRKIGTIQQYEINRFNPSSVDPYDMITLRNLPTYEFDDGYSHISDLQRYIGDLSNLHQFENILIGLNLLSLCTTISNPTETNVNEFKTMYHLTALYHSSSSVTQIEQTEHVGGKKRHTKKRRQPHPPQSQSHHHSHRIKQHIKKVNTKRFLACGKKHQPVRKTHRHRGSGLMGWFSRGTSTPTLPSFQLPFQNGNPLVAMPTLMDQIKKQIEKIETRLHDFYSNNEWTAIINQKALITKIVSKTSYVGGIDTLNKMIYFSIHSDVGFPPFQHKLISIDTINPIITIHKGYKTCFDALQLNAFFTSLQTKHASEPLDTYTYILTGYSEGGIFANLLAYFLTTRTEQPAIHKDKIRVYTFGCPCFIGKEASQYLNLFVPHALRFYFEEDGKTNPLTFMSIPIHTLEQVGIPIRMKSYPAKLELVSLNITNNLIEIVNPYKMFFKIRDFAMDVMSFGLNRLLDVCQELLQYYENYTTISNKLHTFSEYLLRLHDKAFDINLQFMNVVPTILPPRDQQTYVDGEPKIEEEEEAEEEEEVFFM